MTPKISVIVPVYKVELFLRKCINSILCQTYSNLEIILVDDGSPDNCGAICDEFAALDSRIRVIHKPNGGLSSARNAGLDICTGDYIGFVDSDDWIAPDMYAYLIEGALKYQKDITLCEYFNVYQKDEIAVRRYEDEIFDTADAMEALFRLRIGNYAWNKLYKRSLWETIRYPVGKNYEDVLTTYRTFEQSNGVTALKEPKYYYLDNNFGIVRNPSVANQISCVGSRMERFDDIGTQYPQSSDKLYQEIFRYLVDLLWTVYRSSEEEFVKNTEAFVPVCDFIRRHRGDLVAAANSGRLWDYQLKLMEQPRYAVWMLVCRLEKLREKRDRLRNWYRKNCQTKNQWDARMLAFYYQQLSAPLEENAVLLESRGGENMASNIYYLAESLVKRGMKVYLSVYADKTALPSRLMEAGGITDVEYVHKPSKEYYRAYATAKYHFNDMVSNERILKRQGQVWVNVWHGTPLKGMEYDITNQRHALGGTGRAFLACDYLATASEYYTDKMISSAHLNQLLPRSNTAIVCSGFPRNQVFFDQDSRDVIREQLDLGDREVFIYMPTWRGTLFNATTESGNYAIENILAFFESHLEENQILYAKLHPLDGNKLDYSRYTKVLPFPGEYEPYCFLNAADCLITDYSSVFFDFASTRRKILMFCYDKEDYLRNRGLYLPMESLPFPTVYTYEELAAELNTVKQYDDSAFIAEYCTYDCADATENLLKTVIDGEFCCEVKKLPSNGKKNILLYDARMKWRNEKTDTVIKLLNSLDTTESNYFYGFRTGVLKKTPPYLAKLPEGISIFSLPSSTFLTAKEQKKWNKEHRISAKTAKRELDHALPGIPFDEIRIIDDNPYDAFAQILKTSDLCLH